MAVPPSDEVGCAARCVERRRRRIGPRSPFCHNDSWGAAAALIGYAVLGWAVTRRRPELPIGWLLLAGGGVGTATFLATWWASQTLANDPGSLPGGPFAAWLALWLSALPGPLVHVAPLVLFPTGHTRTRRWFWFAAVFGTMIGTLTAVAAVVSLPVAARHAVELLDAPGITATPVAEFAIGLPAIARLITFVATLIALTGLAVARRGVQGDDRQPYTTVLVGAAVVVLKFTADALVPVVFGQQHSVPEAFGSLVGLALPASIAIAVVRFQLYDLRTFVNRSVLVALTAVALSVV